MKIKNQRSIYTSKTNIVPRIAVVVPVLAREGISKQVAHQVKALQQKGIEVFLIILARFPEVIWQELELQMPASKVLKLHQHTAYLSVKALLKSYTLVLPVLRFLKENKVRVVVAHAPYTHFILRLVKLFSFFFNFKFKLCLYYHITQFIQFPTNTFKRKFFNSVTRLLAGKFDDVHISVSEAVKADIEQNLIKLKKHIVIYNALLPKTQDTVPGISIPAETAALQLFAGYSNCYKIVLANRVEQSKGQLFFIRVLQKFLQQEGLHPNQIQLFVVGDGEDTARLETTILQQGLKEYVKLTGALPNKTVLELMYGADLVVVPSFYEGFPIAILEAMSLKKLILASDAGGIREALRHGETGYLFRAGDEADCLEKLLYLYCNRNNVYLNTQQIAADLDNKFSMKNHITKLLEVLEM